MYVRRTISGAFHGGIDQGAGLAVPLITILIAAEVRSWVCIHQDIGPCAQCLAPAVTSLGLVGLIAVGERLGASINVPSSRTLGSCRRMPDGPRIWLCNAASTNQESNWGHHDFRPVEPKFEARVMPREPACEAKCLRERQQFQL